MLSKLLSILKLWLVFALLAFPAFYFVYKYGHPNFGLKDFHDYYKLYKDMDVASVDAPFNMRLLSSFFVYLFYKAGFHYHTEIVFDSLGMDKQVFFSAVLFNYLCVVSTCVVIYYMIKDQLKNVLLSFIGGLLYLLGFGTLFYELMPITDALSVLLFALAFFYYLKRSYWILVPLLLLIFQREYIFLALGLVTLMDYWKFRAKYYMKVLLICIFCFAIYFILRKTIFYTPTYDHQASLGYFVSSIFKLQFPLLPYIKQTVMTMNLFILYIGLVLYKKYKGLYLADRFGLMKQVALFLQINIISFAAVFGNNTGRYLYILVPMVIYQIMMEGKDLVIVNNEK